MTACATVAAMLIDPYDKKTIGFAHAGLSLRFRVSQDLFSSFDIDVGTRFLLRTLAAEAPGPFGSVLDLGCGYGPIGVALGRLSPGARVHMVDRDALAIRYARANADANDLAGAEVYGSLGYDDVRGGPFALIASNIPAKAGDAAISHILRDAAPRLAPGGLVAVVVVTRIEGLVGGVLASTPEAQVVLRRAREGHTVFLYRFGARPPDTDGRSGFARDVYHRGEIEIELGGYGLRVDAAHGLGEWEGPSHATRLLVEGLGELVLPEAPRALVLNPGLGLAAVALRRRAPGVELELADRDLLALRCARTNLERDGLVADHVTVRHTVGAPPDGPEVTLVLGALREDEGPAAVARTVEDGAGRLEPGGRILLAGSSTALSRLVAHLRRGRALRVEDRTRRGGFGRLLLRRA